MSAQNCRRSERLKQQLARGYIERASKLLTDLAYQRAPRGVLMPRAFSASAMWWSDVAPARRISRMTGRTLLRGDPQGS